MERISFEEVWELLHQLQGKTIPTLVHGRRNKIIAFVPTGMIRQAEIPGGKGWKPATEVKKRVFQGMWDRLTQNGETARGQGDWAIAAACLVHVPELGIQYVEGKYPRTLVLRRPAT